MLGASVSPEAAADPSLDSQNRFYGVNFSFLGVALYICATDLRRYEPILKSLLFVFFLSGLARVVSWAVRGAPTPLVIVLVLADLLMPPLLYLWFMRSSRFRAHDG